MKEYSIEIIKLAEKLNLIKSLNAFAGKNLTNKNIKNYNIIINTTSFLVHNPSFRERLWYILTNNHSELLCLQQC